MKLTTQWKVEKYKEGEKEPYEVVEFEGNIALNEGLGEMWDLICGLGTPTQYNSVNARIGVGNGTDGEVATQTGLTGANKAWKGMNTGYPQRSGTPPIVTFQSTFISGEAEFDWQEYTIVNATDDAGKNMNRKLYSLGTKPAGQSWTVTLKCKIT